MRRLPLVALTADGTTARPCNHIPACPNEDSPDREAALVVAAHPEQGWSLLCNGVIAFDDTGDLLSNGTIVAPHRPLLLAASA
ncbi:DUF5999 family protein [Streptomyces sp. SGAir0957]